MGKQNETGIVPATKPKKKRGTDKQWQFDYLFEQFQKESDRAAVILVSSIIDENLGALLKSHLVPIPTSEDNLFDNATSPLSTFSSKIDLCHRIGLISGKFARDLHVLRKIRNSFAHDLYGCSFENGSVKSRIKELENSVVLSKSINSIERDDDLLEGPRGMFLYISGAMIWEINEKIDLITKITERELEFFYKVETEK